MNDCLPDLLFGSKDYEEFQPQRYFAYIDSIELLRENIHIRFDCIRVKEAMDAKITKDEIPAFPTIIVEVTGSKRELRDLFKTSNLYRLESAWCVLETSSQESNLEVREFINLVEITDGQRPYFVANIITYSAMATEEKRVVRDLVSSFVMTESSPAETWQSARQILDRDIVHLNAYHVGQGSCNGLVNKVHIPEVYFDLGGGCNQNTRTFPAGFKVCVTQRPNVILSHWDQDHFHQALLNKDLLNLPWLVPFQNLSNTAKRIAKMLEGRHLLTCWNRQIQSITVNSRSIILCNGASKNKNNSGLAMIFKCNKKELYLLPGDAEYKKIPGLTNQQFKGMVASHHGARGVVKGNRIPAGQIDCRLSYCYGENNTFSHAHSDARTKYNHDGWNNFVNSTNGSVSLSENRLLTPSCGNKCTLGISQQFPI